MDLSITNEISAPVVSSQPQTPTPAQQKKPGLAFLLSLIFPGLGHFYCERITTGSMTAAFFAGTAAFAAFTSPADHELFWGMALRAAIVLYGFGFFDAFFTARDINAGMSDAIIGTNPRIAATLNLLTAGFGYFYLGERKKGLIWFFVSRILMGAGAAQSKYLGVFIEFACIVVAVDAYRIATRQLREASPPELSSAFSIKHVGLSAAVPIALGGLLFCNYAALVSLGLLMPDYKHLEDSKPAITDTADHGKHFRNSDYGIEADLPAEWEFKPAHGGFVMSAHNPELGCQFGLMMQPSYPLTGRESRARELGRELAKNPTYKWLSTGVSQIGDKQAYAINYQTSYNSIPVLQRMIFIQHGLTLYVVHEAAALSLSDECAPMMDQIARSVRLGF